MYTNQNSALSLMEWSEIIGVSPFWLAQITEPRDKLSRVNAACNDPFFQSPFQTNNQLSREQIAQAIENAENRIANYLGYPVAPIYKPEPIPYRGPKWDFRGMELKKPYQLRYSHIQRFGKRAVTQYNPPAPITINYADPYSLGFNTHFDFTFTVPANTLPRDILIFHTEANTGSDYNAEKGRGQIRGANITVNGVTAKVWGSKVLLVKPIHMLTYAPETLNMNTTGHFADSVEIYLQSFDETLPAVLEYLDRENCPNPPCGLESQNACLTKQDLLQGTVEITPADWDATAEKWVYPSGETCKNWEYRQATIYYEAGLPRDELNRVAEPYNRIIAYAATALLPERTCGCGQADNQIVYYRNMNLNEAGESLATEGMLRGAFDVFGVAGRGAVQAYAQLRGIKENQIYERG